MSSSPLPITIAIGGILLARAASAAESPDFAHDIVPLLRNHCGQCHTGDHKKGGYTMNTRAGVIAGGEGGSAVVPANSGKSEFIRRVLSREKDEQMPPEGPRLTAKEVSLLKNWIDAGLPWQEGFALKPPTYEPPLKPRQVELPPAVNGRTNPIDRLVDAFFAQHNIQRPPPADDSTLIRRLSLDLTGLLPVGRTSGRPLDNSAASAADSSPGATAGSSSSASDNRTALVHDFLSDDVAYAEHWLTFWNDLLRNDYAGTGFITGGRKQITGWLYRSLVDNKPYDQMVRELISPTADSEGFIQGIKWRGTVNASQTIEVQFAQNISQAFLGINMKCASCHDSFIDHWKLSEAYGLAAIYASQPLAIHRCDKPTGATASAAWIFPELGQIDADAPQPERLKQLASLMTHPENGRFTRTIVNRLWHRLMGRGIVHPVDAMHTEPWSADLLDWLATDFAAHNYDLKHTLALIATSDIYQAQTPPIHQPDAQASDSDDFIFHGPLPRRLTAEQFVDCVWQLTDAAPTKTDAQVVRARVSQQHVGRASSLPDMGGRGSRRAADNQDAFQAHWIWSTPSQSAPANQSLTFRRQFKLPSAPTRAVAVITCDNEYRLLVNNREIEADDNWETAELVSLDSALKTGDNEILIVAKNTGNSRNAAGLIFQASIQVAEGSEQTIATDESWQWTTAIPDAKGRFPNPDDPTAKDTAAKDAKAKTKRRPADWQPAAIVPPISAWTTRVADSLPALLHQGTSGPLRMVRASLLKSNDLMRALGRPNRDQIVSMRPTELTTLEAISLANGETLASTIEKGAAKWLAPMGQASSLPYKPDAPAREATASGATAGSPSSAPSGATAGLPSSVHPATATKPASPNPTSIINQLYLTALSRPPTAAESQTASDLLGPHPTSENLQDLLWSLIMLPEFQLVR